MKVSELFEATNIFGQQGGASNKPGYRDDIKQLRGSVLDWMDAMGVNKEHIAKAIAQVKGSPLFRNDFPAAGLDGRSYTTRYNIYANGQIRWEGANSPYSDGDPSTSPLRSPKPRMKAGDPVGSLVMIYEAAMVELLDKWKKSVAKMEKADAKAAKEKKK